MYKEYYLKESQIPPLRTLDVDFLVPLPLSVKTKHNIPDLLLDLGFVQDFVGSQGYIRLEHPDLMLEFLVHEKGRGEEKPVDLKNFSINAQPLRFLNVLQEKTIEIKMDNKSIVVPHPAWFAIHKLIVAQRRSKKDKANKDLTAAIALLQDLIDMKKKSEIRKAFNFVSKKWQKKIIKLLKDCQEEVILAVILE